MEKRMEKSPFFYFWISNKFHPVSRLPTISVLPFDRCFGYERCLILPPTYKEHLSLPSSRIVCTTNSHSSLRSPVYPPVRPRTKCKHRCSLDLPSHPSSSSGTRPSHSLVGGVSTPVGKEDPVTPRRSLTRNSFFASQGRRLISRKSK